MNLTLVLFVIAAFGAGIALGAIYHRKWKKLHDGAQSANDRLMSEIMSERAAKDLARSEAETAERKLERASETVKRLQPLAEKGEKYVETQQRHNEKRKAERAAARVTGSTTTKTK